MINIIPQLGKKLMLNYLSNGYNSSKRQEIGKLCNTSVAAAMALKEQMELKKHGPPCILREWQEQESMKLES